jgi:hypothetical protein
MFGFFKRTCITEEQMAAAVDKRLKEIEQTKNLFSELGLDYRDDVSISVEREELWYLDRNRKGHYKFTAPSWYLNSLIRKNWWVSHILETRNSGYEITFVAEQHKS